MKEATKTNQKDFLTLDEVKAKGLYYHVYSRNENAYKYEIESKGFTLKQNGRILCENVDHCHWYAKWAHEYYIQGKGYILKENGRILCENVDYCLWYQRGVYEYYIQGKGRTLKENDVILCENVYYCYWHSKGVYEYRPTEDSAIVKVGF